MARLRVRLTPRAGGDALGGWRDGVLHVRVAAPPADGRANDALLRLVAAATGVPPSRVTLVSGARSRVKLIEITGLSEDDVARRLRPNDEAGAS
ncbi:MAG: DUF167 domain-containing protein [Chloroflexi bacterium]|nr:DUF167 domain-containing protein [Chloroflexota bacterium]